jgi:protein SCO1/2
MALVGCLAALLAVGLAACSGDDDDESPREADGTATTAATDAAASPSATGGGSQTSGFRTGTVKPAFKKPDVTLTDQDGQPFNFQQETEGKITLFYIGYTNCPDICPTHLATAAAAMEQLPEDVRSEVEFVFATADPARDTPEVLKDYLAQFNPDFIGLTGTEEQMAELQRFFGLGVASKVEDDSADGGYGLNHMSLVVAYGDDDLGHVVFPAGVTLDAWVHDLTKLTREGFPEDA